MPRGLFCNDFFFSFPPNMGRKHYGKLKEKMSCFGLVKFGPNGRWKGNLKY